MVSIGTGADAGLRQRLTIYADVLEESASHCCFNYLNSCGGVWSGLSRRAGTREEREEEEGGRRCWDLRLEPGIEWAADLYACGWTRPGRQEVCKIGDYGLGRGTFLQRAHEAE